MSKIAHLSPAPVSQLTQTNPYPIAQSSRNLTHLAWVITLLISTLPDVVWSELAEL